MSAGVSVRGRSGMEETACAQGEGSDVEEEGERDGCDQVRRSASSFAREEGRDPGVQLEEPTCGVSDQRHHHQAEGDDRRDQADERCDRALRDSVAALQEPSDSECGQPDEHTFDQGGRNEVDREERDCSWGIFPNPVLRELLGSQHIQLDQVESGEDHRRDDGDCDEGEWRPMAQY